MKHHFLILVLTVMPSTGNAVNGQTEQTQAASSRVVSPGDRPDEKPIGYPNWKTRTLNGQQFWTDIRNVSGWRVQRNSETDHCRLLDPQGTRHAWGNGLHCQQMLDQMIAEGTAKQPSGKVIVVLHGLIRTKASMQPMADYLSSNTEFTSINFQYASTRKKVGEHAFALKSMIDGFGPEVTEINFIGHSLGNIVVRRYLGDTSDQETGNQGDPRIKRFVMLGPPNQGSRMARILKSSFLFNTIAGVSGAELSRSWDNLEPSLATPKFEFGIIAGGQRDDARFSNFILKGKDDFTVSVAEAKLIGAHDFLVRPLLHSTMMHQPEVLEASLSFFRNGYFVSPEARSPLTAAPSASASSNVSKESKR